MPRQAAAAGRKRRSRDEAGGDDFYAEAAAARAATKAEKWRRHEAPALAPPLEDPSAEGQRPISYAIQKNRGLTPHRCTGAWVLCGCRGQSWGALLCAPVLASCD